MSSTPSKTSGPGLGARFHAATPRVVPILVWVAAIFAAAALWHRGRTDLTGYLRRHEVSVSSLDARRVTALFVRLHERVERGDMLVALDDTRERQQLETIQSEIARLHAEVQAERLRLEIELDRNNANWADVERAFLIDRTDKHIAYLEQLTTNASDQIRFQGQNTEFQIVQELYSNQSAPFREINRIRTEVNELRERIAQNKAVTETKRAAFRDFDRRWQVFLQAHDGNWRYDAVLTPIKLAIEVQQREIESLSYQIERLVLRSPFEGQVTAILALAETNVQPGVPIVTVAASTGDRVITYLPPEKALQVAPGAVIRLERVAAPGQEFRGRVLSLADTIGEIPIRHRRLANQVEWGRAIVIQFLQQTTMSEPLLAGEPFRIRF